MYASTEPKLFLAVIGIFQVKKSRSKVVPALVMTAYRGSRGIAPFILNFGTSWR
jgi:hypothetical protein